ncbi:SWIM zinc finger family protein [Nocardia uniformis]|uniref:SWIM zinc finger family protein n=1 Tax=Nocardia uniformis TaxID=53432 RepID=A0A849C055_9NOCA|nr:SWIM zinc finger family protein [Nocardia uniformis]NNH69725.1 SWIM zinc finger family protein [Nocardia uniformis]
MSTRWSADQIAALAPDAASLSAARKLRGKWSETGQFDTTLWGLCKGSGSRPYQAVIDLAGPAYKCTCPSRKFPCKHALGLLLTWSEGGVREVDAPADFAAEWLATRAAREAKKAAPEANTSRSSNATTAGQRQARVTAGLADLDMWLADQVRTGLAQADRSHHAFETVAARMVDAQAPGLALTLRQFPRIAARADWPHRLLREYGRLHLLIAAHQRLDQLSPALGSSIRTHIGFPTPVDSVRTEPSVRDHWMVLAARTSVEDALYTRRVWLRGRRTGRWALLLDHHHGSPSFPQDTPAPGFQVDADLHYYPAAAPMRAIWGERHSAPEPFTTIPRTAAADDEESAALHENGSAAIQPNIVTVTPSAASAALTVGTARNRSDAVLGVTDAVHQSNATLHDTDSTGHAADTTDNSSTAPHETGTPHDETGTAGDQGDAVLRDTGITARDTDTTRHQGGSVHSTVGHASRLIDTTTEIHSGASAQSSASRQDFGRDPLRRGEDSDREHAGTTKVAGRHRDPNPSNDGVAGRISSGRGTIADALREHAEALGADPFLRAWPVLLIDVVPARGDSGWRVVESEGDALPVSAEDGEPWRMLGVSGGHPVTIVGEWTTDGLVPLSVFGSGTVVDAVAVDGVSASGSTGSAAASIAVDASTEADAGTGELVSTALVGTARRTADTGTLPAPVADVAAGLNGDAAVTLLESVALQECFTRGAVSPGSAEVTEPAGEDPRPVLPPAAAARLGTLLTDTSSFLAEWFTVAEPFDYRAPEAMCSRLLERAKSVATYREPLLRLAGVRGRWLASQHPGWRTLVRATVADETVWSHGRAPERRAWLARSRRVDPIAARDALAGSWAKESGPGKVELLAVLADGLSAADEALLESALDDRRADVRRLAADLLARLPDSDFVRRMTTRAAAWVSFGERLAQPLLTTTGPGVLDDAARRDGVGDSFTFTVYRADGSPDLAAEWLHRVVAATGLPHWEVLLGAPDQAVRVPMADSLRGPMFAGWADAALAQRNPVWARALFAVITGSPAAGDPDVEKLRELFAIQPLEDQVRHLRQLDSSWLAEIESLLRAVTHPWPTQVADHVLRLLMERARLSADRPGAPSLVPGSYRTLFRAASTNFPVTAAPAVTAAADSCGDPYWEQAFDQLAGDLMERKTMLEELT